MKFIVEGPIWLMQPIPYFGEELKGNWIVEPKYDGWRMQVVKTSLGKIDFFGRRLEKNPCWTQKLSYLVKIIDPILPNGTILDCELCSDKGRRYIPSVFCSFKAKPIVYIFDVVFFNNEFLGELSLKKRKEILSKIKLPSPFYQTEFHYLTSIEEELKNFVSLGHEGIVIKEVNSKYNLSKDAPVATEFWRKIKP